MVNRKLEIEISRFSNGIKVYIILYICLTIFTYHFTLDVSLTITLVCNMYGNDSFFHCR